MTDQLPSTPAEVLHISSALRMAMNAVCKSAELLGYWDLPYRNAATCFEEMSLLDKLYWAYKCKRPVTRFEDGASPGLFMERDPRLVGLPPEFEKSTGLSLAAVGDLIQTDTLAHSANLLYERIADLLFDRDIAYANLESPLTTQTLHEEVISDKESPIECCSREQFDILKGHKGRFFTVMHTAGNHMADMGVEGVQTTQRQFSADRIVDVGTNRKPEEYGRGRIIERNGLRIGFVSATYGLNGRDLPPEEAWRINVARMHSKRAEPDLSLLKRQLQDCRDQACDFIIASLHWGYEFEFFPRRHQIDIAHELIESGADAIIGHHPHVIQPVEYYRTRRDPDRIAVIAYSLGSLNWTFTAPHLALSLVLNLNLAKGMYRGAPLTYIERSTVTPVFRRHLSLDGVPVTRIEKLADHPGDSDAIDPEYIAAMRRHVVRVLDQSKGDS
ncbi:MAG: CapA family protein [Burkholderiales bacterium]